MDEMGIPMPASGMAGNMTEALAIARKIGYPLMVRPSFVLGGRGMEVVHDDDMLKEYVTRAIDLSPERPILIDQFLQEAVECEADALADGEEAFVPAVMEHIEWAGVHSGDSACVIPPVTLPAKHVKTIEEYTARIGRELKVKGMMNVQYAVEKDKLYVLEANPRASRTVPLVSKICGLSMARVATQLMLGARLKDLYLKKKKIPYFGVKEAVLPFNMFPEVDPVLGPEMRSTGEVLGLASTFGLAYYKSQEAVSPPLPLSGRAFISVSNPEKKTALPAAKKLHELGFSLLATAGTHEFLEEHGVPSEVVLKLHEGRPNITDRIMNGEVQLIINTPAGKLSQYDDSYIRKAAVKYKLPYITTAAAAVAAVQGIAEMQGNRTSVKSLQEYHRLLV
jgi:carbamoyl-phosphate synthase large subunit